MKTSNDAVREELDLALSALSLVKDALHSNEKIFAERISTAVACIRRARDARVPYDEDFERYVVHLNDWYEDVQRHRPNADDGEFISIEFSGHYEDPEGDGDGMVVAGIETKRHQT